MELDASLSWLAEKEVDAIKRIGCKVVNWNEPEYPQNLLQITTLRCCCRLDAACPPSLAPANSISTHRHAPIYGTQMAVRLSRELAAKGLTIVGGLVRGIAAIAHKGATEVGGRAIGVLGTGIDVCYPKENKKLYEKVLERGTIISEFSVGWHPAPENFPVRNRIIDWRTGGTRRRK